MREKLRETYKKFVFYAIKLPLSMVLITIGYTVEFLLGLPFVLIGLLDDLFDKRA